MNMNIQRINQAAEMYQSMARKTAAPRKNGSARDEITISPEAKLYDYARKAAAGIPDIREDLVSSIQKRVNNGSYNIPVSALADKLLEE